jgi:hypothetical protein
LPRINSSIHGKKFNAAEKFGKKLCARKKQGRYTLLAGNTLNNVFHLGNVIV